MVPKTIGGDAFSFDLSGCLCYNLPALSIISKTGDVMITKPWMMLLAMMAGWINRQP